MSNSDYDDDTDYSVEDEFADELIEYISGRVNTPEEATQLASELLNEIEKKLTLADWTTLIAEEKRRAEMLGRSNPLDRIAPHPEDYYSAFDDATNKKTAGALPTVSL